MGSVNVSHFKTSTVAVESARSKSRKTALVGQLGKRVGLVHELRKLGTTEEIANNRAERFRVDQLLRRHAFDVHIKESHALFYEALGAGKTDAALVGKKLTNSTNTA